jgi:hypothetical protein
MDSMPYSGATASMRLRWRWVLLAWAFPVGLIAGPATRLVVVIPGCIGVCPGGVPNLTSVASGKVVSVSVYAADASGNADTGYRGTVTLGSTDPLATLPSVYTFTAADHGSHDFLNSAVLRTLGGQTLSADDVINALHGTWFVTVVSAQGAQGIPMTAGVGKTLLVVLISVAGIWLLSARS